MRLKGGARLTLTLTLTLICIFSVADLFAVDPQDGRWKLNVTRSTFNPPASAPKSQVTKIEAVDGGVRNTTDVVDPQGKSIHYTFTAQYDGKDYAVTGDPNRDTIAIRKIDDYTFELTNKKAGKVVTTSRVVYARDGKSRTFTTTATNAQGDKLVTTAVWDRQ